MHSLTRRRILSAGAAACGALALVGCATQPQPALSTPRVGETSMPRHQLLVTLDVKPEAFDGYIAAMRQEETGARSEAGNLGFDLWGDGAQPHVIWLLEYWASESALTVDHAKQPYYRHVRGMEAEALTGQFEERLLVELGTSTRQTPGASKSLDAPSAQLSIWATVPADLVQTFDASAQAVRAAAGNRFWQLYANTRRPGEALLIEAWDSPAARTQADSLPGVAALRAQTAQGAAQSVALRKI